MFQRTVFQAHQFPQWSAKLWYALIGDRVRIAGSTVLYLGGEIHF